MFHFFRKKTADSTLFYHTDVHSHILPYVDHGAQHTQMGIDLLKAEMKMGISRVVLTSHVTSEVFENTNDSLTQAFIPFQEAVKEAGIDIQLHLSAEYRIDEFWRKQYEEGKILPMPGNYLLLENSFYQELIGSEQIMFDLNCRGYHPILAHPERYPYYAQDKDRYTAMHQSNVLFQVNILSFTGYFGHTARETAFWLLNHDLVDFLGSDIHHHKHAKIIKDYLAGKEWRKIAQKLQGRILNDEV